MHRILNQSFMSNLLRLTALCIFIMALQGCSVMRSVQEKFWQAPGLSDTEIARHEFSVANGDDVIGRMAMVRLEDGDTLPDIARHFGLGINAVSAANPGVDIWVPADGKRIILPLSFILPDTPRAGIVINLATMRLFRFKGDGTSRVVSTYPLGIGAEDRPTPRGQARVVRKATRPTWYVPSSIAERHRKKGDILPAAVPPGPENPLGEYALYLSMSGYLIHGTNKPASIGLKATNGCMRLYPENIDKLYKETPVNTPVLIVNQPYLIGQRDGILYMEAHAPLEGPAGSELEKIYAQLKTIEKKSGRALDWKKIKEIQNEARGIPIPLFEMRPGSGIGTAEPIHVEHPDTLYGKPEIPELDLGAWYVLAADARDETDARRIAAIINHQGPPIPARVLSGTRGYRVVAGPFNNGSEANEAVKRLKIDLEIDGIVIEPVRKG